MNGGEREEESGGDKVKTVLWCSLTCRISVYRYSSQYSCLWFAHVFRVCLFFNISFFVWGAHFWRENCTMAMKFSALQTHFFRVFGATAVAAMNHLNRTMQNAETTVSLWFPQNMHFHLRNDIIHTHVSKSVRCTMCVYDESDDVLTAGTCYSLLLPPATLFFCLFTLIRVHCVCSLSFSLSIFLWSLPLSLLHRIMP